MEKINISTLQRKSNTYFQDLNEAEHYEQFGILPQRTSKKLLMQSLRQKQIKKLNRLEQKKAEELQKQKSIEHQYKLERKQSRRMSKISA
jgi:hypothetical protein